jgi:PAS domain S-box-containing protein
LAKKTPDSKYALLIQNSCITIYEIEDRWPKNDRIKGKRSKVQMKIGTKLVLSFLVIALFIFILIMINSSIMEKVNKQSLTEEYAHELSKNIYLEETVADTYIRRAASEYFEIEENATEVEVIAQEFYQIHDNNSVSISKLRKMLSTDEEREIISFISDNHEELNNVFETNHRYYKSKINKLAGQKYIGIKIADLRHNLKLIITDPANFEQFSKDIEFYSPVSKKTENKNVLTLFRQLGYKEKEYVWQYKDEKHLDDVLSVVSELDAIIVLTGVSEDIKSEILSILYEYKNNIIDFIHLVDENDLDRLSALSSKYSRDLWILREDEISRKLVYNPVYGDKFRQYRKIMVGNTEQRVSFEYLLFEFGHHEKEVLYQDKGIKTVHYDEILTTYDSMNTIIKILDLSQSDIIRISSILENHRILLDNFMEGRTESEEAISEITQEKTIKITEMRKIYQEIQEGNSSVKKAGLNSLAGIQGARRNDQVNTLIMANLIGGLFVVLIAICIGLYIPYSISRPLTDLSLKANEIGMGNLDAKIKIRSKDEIGALAASFNKMTDDLRQSRDEIIKAKEYTGNIVRSMTDTLIVVSPDGIIQTVNPSLCKLLGYREHELIDRSVMMVFEDNKELQFNGSINSDSIEKGSFTNIERTYFAKNGRKIPMLFSSSVMLDDNGKFQGIVCVAQDITERKQAEEALKKLSSAVEQSADNVIITNKNSVIEYVNPAFEKLTGYSRKEVIGKKPDILKSGKHNKKFYKNLYETIIYGKVFRSEIINKKKNGELYHTETTIMPITDIQGNITHFVSTEKDINELKKAEMMLIENQKLAYASKAKSEFLANMSHELRTPLNSILGFSELMIMNANMDKKQKHYLENVLTSGKFLLNLINDILDLSKVESGKIELVIGKMNVPSVIDETSSLIKEKASRNNILMKKELDPALIYIEVDQQRFKQVMFNLLSNAVKFSKPDGGTITISAKKDGDMAKFSVSDTGIGIKDEDMGRLFSAFEQLDAGITQKYGGTGLGLAISKKLVQLHGGTITVESGHRKGSTFTFTLPIKAIKQGGTG